MNPIAISVINESTILKQADLPALVAAVQVQVSQHFAPVWQVDAALQLPANNQPADGTWQLVFRDVTDFQNVSGYHNVDENGVPYGRVFMKTAQDNQQSWTVAASHEVLEMLVNPYSILAAYVPQDDNTGSFYQLEICDPVAPDNFGYTIQNVAVSDFVFPTWFSPYLAQPDSNRPAKQVDYTKSLNGPVPNIVPGTTISVFGWRDVSSPVPAAAQAAVRIGAVTRTPSRWTKVPA